MCFTMCFRILYDPSGFLLSEKAGKTGKPGHKHSQTQVCFDVCPDFLVFQVFLDKRSS